MVRPLDPTRTPSPETDLDDDIIEDLARGYNPLRKDPIARNLMRSYIAASLAHKFKINVTSDPNKLKQLGELADKFLDTLSDPAKAKKFFKAGGEGYKDLTKILGRDDPSVKRLLSEWLGDFAGDTAGLPRGVPKLTPPVKPTYTADTKSGSDAQSSGKSLGLPTLVGSATSEVAKLVLKSLLDLTKEDSKEEKEKTLQQKRQVQIEKLFPSPYKVPLEVQHDFEGLGKVSEAVYASIYDNAMMVAVKQREKEEQDAISQQMRENR